MPSEATALFLALLEHVATSYEAVVSSAPESTEAVNQEEEDRLFGTLEFTSEEEGLMRLQLEQEKLSSWSAVRATLVFGISPEEEEWSEEESFLEAFLLCRTVPGTFFPLAPTFLPEGGMQWHCVLPLQEESKELLVALVDFASTFYQGLLKHVRDLGFGDELTQQLRSLNNSSQAVWSMGRWSRQKALLGSRASEDYSSEGHYYRLIAATAEAPGMIAINLGNLSGFIGIEKIFPELLKINAMTFLSDNYYVGLDDRGGLLLQALLPPAEEAEAVYLVNQLLQRAMTVRSFIQKITTDLEVAHIESAFKGLDTINEIIFT